MVLPHVRPVSFRLHGFDRGLVALVALFALLLPIWTGRLYAVDSVEYFSYLPAFFLHHSLDFTDEFRYFDQHNPQAGIGTALLIPEKRDPVTGRPINVAPIGTAILWSPAWLATHAVMSSLHALGLPVQADGVNRPYTLAVSALSTLYGLGALLLAYRLARQWVGTWAATVAVAVCLLATPVLFYTYISPPWSHAAALFALTLFLWYWLRTRPTPTQRQWVILGLLGGLIALCREQLGLWLILPAIDGIIGYWQAVRAGRWDLIPKALRHHLVFVGVVSLCLVPQLLTYHALTGAYRPSSHVAGKLEAGWWSPHFFDTLVDPSHGAFIWTPIWLVGFVGLGWLWPRNRRLAATLVAGLLLQIYINGSFGTTWHLTGSFGFRRLIEATPLFAIGVGLMIERLQLPRGTVLAVATLLVVWNIGLIVQWSLPPRPIKEGLVWQGMLDRQLQVPATIERQADLLLFHRCKLVQNEGC